MTSLIDAFSGAFHTRALPDGLWVLGLRYPRLCRLANVFSDSMCPTCHTACRSFPLASIANFECEGSSCRHRPSRNGPFYSEGLYGVDVCLQREAIKDIVAREWPGGRSAGSVAPAPGMMTSGRTGRQAGGCHILFGGHGL